MYISITESLTSEGTLPPVEKNNTAAAHNSNTLIITVEMPITAKWTVRYEEPPEKSKQTSVINIFLFNINENYNIIKLKCLQI